MLTCLRCVLAREENLPNLAWMISDVENLKKIKPKNSLDDSFPN